MAWMQIAVMVGVAVIRAGVNYLMTPKEEVADPKPPGIGRIEWPYSSESNPIPVVFGTVLLEGPNVVWYGDFQPDQVAPGTPRPDNVSPGRSPVYGYYVGMHLVYCHGPVDYISRIYAGGKLVDSGVFDEVRREYYSMRYLFGGPTRGEGGIEGRVTTMVGLPDQAPLAYLVDQMPGHAPAYRGVVSLVLESPYLGTSPRLKPWAIEVKRTSRRSFGDLQWQLIWADISGDMNPAHIVRECLTDAAWGLGLPESDVDDSSFLAAALALHGEDFGLSLVWTQQTTISAFIKEILRHIDGVLYHHPRTGKLVLKLVRNDYDPDALPVFGASEIETVVSFSRPSMYERINQVSVVWSDREFSGDRRMVERTATVHDAAQVALRGEVPVTHHYPGITSSALANRVAQRDLRQLGLPLAHVELRIAVGGEDLMPGDVFAWSWPEYGVERMMLRAISVNHGTLTDQTVTVQCVEDHFSWEDTIYDDPQPTEWEDPVPDVQPPAELLALEEPWWLLMQRRARSAPDGYDVYQPSDMTTGRALLAAGPPLSGHYPRWELHSAPAGDALAHNGLATFADVLYLATALPQAGDALEWSNDVAPPIGPDALPLIVIGDEIVLGWTMLGPRSLAINRGMLDTTPRLEAYPVGTRAVVIGYITADGLLLHAGSDRERASGTTVELRAQTRTARDLLPLESSPAEFVTLAARARRPYPPGCVELSDSGGEFRVEWAHRDRLSRANRGLQFQGEGDVGPEPGTTYVVQIYGENGVGHEQLVVENGTPGTFATLKHSDELVLLDRPTLSPWLRVELWAVRDGVTSYQRQRRLYTR